MNEYLNNVEMQIEDGALEGSPADLIENLQALLAAGQPVAGDYLKPEAVQFWHDLEAVAALARQVCELK